MATPVKQRLDMIHDLAQCAQLRQAPGDVHASVAFRSCQTALDKQNPILEQVADFLLNRFVGARRAAGRFVGRRRSPALQLELGLGQAVALFGYRFQDPLSELLDDMEGTQLMGHFTKDRADRFGIERRAIGRDPLEFQVALLQGGPQTPKKCFDIVMSGIVIEDLIEHPFVLPIVDGCEDTVWALIEFISRHVARKRRKRPVQKRAVHLPLRLFFPQPPSNSGW